MAFLSLLSASSPHSISVKSISFKGGVKMHNRSAELPITIFSVNKAWPRFSLISLIRYFKKFGSKSFTACTGYINSIFDH